MIVQNQEELPIIIKSDVHGSSEAIKNSIEKIKHAEVVSKNNSIKYRGNYRNRRNSSKSIRCYTP